MAAEQPRCIYAVTSSGLWALRGDLSILMDAEIRLWPFCKGSELTGFIGWGRRPSALRAMREATRNGKECVLLEDGFLKSYAPGQGDPAHSFVLDRRGMFFDIAKPNDLAELLERPGLTDNEFLRARAAIDFIRTNRISKYNNSPLVGLANAGVNSKRPFVLLVDQVAGDASIKGALASEASFGAMLEHAVITYPGVDLVVRTHPAAGLSSLLGQAARRLSIPILVPDRMNPWPLLEQADSVYTVSSQLGFEALMAGCKVHCFGATYYSHRGLTDDHIDLDRMHPAIPLEALFHRAYIDYSRYLDLHDRTPVEIETALEQIITVRDHRNRIARPVFTGGLSPWKRKAISPFTTGPSGKPVHCLTLGRAAAKARTHGGMIALWGSSKPLPEDVASVRFEDGFIRSRGLGANLTLPCSLAMDGNHPYYDARGPSLLEDILNTHPFPEPLVVRAEKLAAMIVGLGVSKYNVGSAVEFPAVQSGRLKILIPGQVEKDASIRFGSPIVRTNADLVAAVRLLFPDAYIVYKQHPDVTAGVRSGGLLPTQADIVVQDGDINHWIGWSDRIETMTSLTGFEALLRHKPVGIHGMPFYAGWGLTDDRMDILRRGRRLSIGMLAAATLILYPTYIHPLSGMPCRPEDLVNEIARRRPVVTSRLARFKTLVFRSINRAAVRIRDKSV